MNRIVDRSTSSRGLGLLAGVVAIVSFTAVLLLAVLTLRGQVGPQEEPIERPQSPVDIETAESVDNAECLDNDESTEDDQEIAAEVVIQKSSFGRELSVSDAAIRDLALLVQVELFLAEGDLSVPAEATEEQYRIDENKIYFGNAKKFQKPCVIEAKRVYEGIPSYQKIVENGFTKDNPEYWPLMRKAAAAFVRALKGVCKESKFDLVGEVGSIACQAHKVPDVTGDVLKQVAKAK